MTDNAEVEDENLVFFVWKCGNCGYASVGEIEKDAVRDACLGCGSLTYAESCENCGHASTMELPIIEWEDQDWIQDEES
jgi:ribosomal protein L37E